MQECAIFVRTLHYLGLLFFQVYNRVSKQICYLDKYYGRKLDRTGLLRTLRKFFHNGHRTRHELMWPIIARLREIRDSLERLRTYRFYSSSLLIIYEGDPSSESQSETEKYQGESEGPSSVKLTPRPNSQKPDSRRSDRGGSPAADKLIDVRMVDFAKSTNQDLDSSFKHDGPDHGYIFGLENLIKLLKEIARSSCPNGGYEGDNTTPSSDTHRGGD